jgi:uncharacterized protein
VQLPVFEVSEEPIEIEKTLEVNWLESFLGGEQQTDFFASSPQIFRGRIQRVGMDVILQANFLMQLEAECSRCLKNFQFDLPIDFQLTLRPRPQHQDPLPNEQELTSEDLDQDFYDNELIDLGTIVREQILLALPMFPRCAEECRGLCATCGQDLNQGACDCDRTDVDPRWDVLKTLVH